MKKQVVATVMMLSLAIVMTGCNSGVSSNTVSPDTQITQEAPDWNNATKFTYANRITIERGTVLTQDMLALSYTEDSLDEIVKGISFIGKTYDSVGEFKESFKADGDICEVIITVVDKTAPVIEGTHDIEVVEGSEVNLLDGISTNEGELTVSDYDASLLDEVQKIVYTAKDSSDNISTKEVSLLIKSNPIEALDKTMYAQSTVNVRSGCSTENEKLGSLSTNDAVHIVGRDKASGWYQIEFNGSLGYVSNNYLGDSQVVISKPSSSGGNSSNSGGSSSNSSSGQSSTPSSSDSGNSTGGSSSGSDSGSSSSGIHSASQDDLDAMMNDKPVLPTYENGNTKEPPNIYN